MKNIYLTSLIISVTLMMASGQNKEMFSKINYEDSLRQIYLNDMDSIILEKLFYVDSVNSIISSFGMQVSQFKTNDGFASSTEVMYFLKGRNKSIEMGLYFDDNTRFFQGLTFGHKYFIFRNRFNENTIFEPYLMYKFIYRVTTLKTTLSAHPERTWLIPVGEARYASMEHYAGAGVEINVSKNFYINTSVGFGRYLGSIKKPTNPDQYSGIYEGGDGWGGIYKIGLGIRIP